MIQTPSSNTYVEMEEVNTCRPRSLKDVYIRNGECTICDLEQESKMRLFFCNKTLDHDLNFRGGGGGGEGEKK